MNGASCYDNAGIYTDLFPMCLMRGLDRTGSGDIRSEEENIYNLQNISKTRVCVCMLSQSYDNTCRLA